MVKKSSPTEKAARLLDLVPYLYSHQGIALSDLSSTFGVSESEIISDLNTLWMCGESRFDLVDLEFESGFVSIRNAESLNMVRSLSTQETMSILFGLDLLREELGDQRADLIDQIDALKVLLNEQISHIVSASPLVNTAILETIHASIEMRKALSITYRSISDDVISTRTVDALEFVSRGSKVFLHAFCHSAQSGRTFRLDRIESATLTQVDATTVQSLKQSPSTLEIKLRIHSESRRAHETFGNLRENPDGSYQGSVFSKQWLIREILASAGAIELLEPVEIRDEIALEATALSAAYR